MASPWQAIKDTLQAIDEDRFPMMINPCSPAIGLKVPSSTSWEVTPLVTPAEVCKT